MKKTLGVSTIDVAARCPDCNGYIEAVDFSNTDDVLRGAVEATVSGESVEVVVVCPHCLTEFMLEVI